MSTFNPLDFKGPEFLFFYIILSCVSHLIFRRFINNNENNPLPSALDMTDPYAIAYLRGGKEEAARVAIFSLIDRGLLKANRDKVKTVNFKSNDLTKRKIEKAAVEFFLNEAKPNYFFFDTRLDHACAEYNALMVRNGLTVNSDQHKFRSNAMLITLIPILALPLAKIYVALVSGHTNIALLVALTVMNLNLLFQIVSNPRTKTGSLFLSYLRQMFSELKNRVPALEPGGKTNEAALCAAVFGFSPLTYGSFGFVKTLFPGASKTNSNDNLLSDFGGSCGSGCGGCSGGCGGCGGN